MTIQIFVVTNEENGDPEVFTNENEAFDYMKNEIIDYSQKWDFSLGATMEAIEDMTKEYNNGDFDYFGGYLGECELCCYRKEIRL